MKQKKASKLKPSEPPFTTVHNLAFEIAPWRFSDEFVLFRVETCHGQWRSTALTYDILSIVNEQPGNGHLEDVFQWFEHSCRRDNRALRVLEIVNERFRQHLVQKRGFTAFQQHCVKIFD